MSGGLRSADDSNAPQRPPHILFILMDDLGWADVGFNHGGWKRELTPHIDSLATDGVILDRHYVHMICSPTRSAIQTGRAPVHVNVVNSPDWRYNPEDTVGGFSGIPLNMTCIASLLRQASYKTHFVGKWDVGMATPGHTPAGRGYDTGLFYFGHTIDSWSFKPHACYTYDFWEHDTADASMPFVGQIARNHMNRESCSAQTEDDDCQHVEWVLEKRVSSIISNHDIENPLFLFWSTRGVHSKADPPLSFRNDFEKLLKSEKVPVDEHTSAYYASHIPHYAMLMQTDAAIGRVVSLLKAKDMYDDTLIVFSSDNGADAGIDNTPLRGSKRSNFEGGVRSCACVSGGVVPLHVRGTRADGMIAAWDWYATFAYLAGVDPTDHVAATAGLPAIDSLNVWPYLAKESLASESPRTVTYMGNHKIKWNILQDTQGATLIGGMLMAVDDKLYKLILGGFRGDHEPCAKYNLPENRAPGEPGKSKESCALHLAECGTTPEKGCLFEVKSDPGERINLAPTMPKIFNRLLESTREMTVYSPIRTNDERFADTCGKPAAPYLFNASKNKTTETTTTTSAQSGECQSWCVDNPQPWTYKCTWIGCSGCEACSATPSTSTVPTAPTATTTTTTETPTAT